MAKPRVFVSSTFYDLKQVRSDLEIFIKELGYEPVLNEQGSIPYGKEDKIEEYCYKEISNIDLFVSIIGGRFGSRSLDQNLSVSQMEFKTAIRLHRQVYIFIEKNVYAEYQTYLLNKENKGIRYRFVDDVRIYEFIGFCEGLPSNNNICAFETSKDIARYLKEQWAGLFQLFLRSQSKSKSGSSAKITPNETRALHQYGGLLSQNPENAVSLIQNGLFSEHPAIQLIKQFLDVKYRIYFITDDELTEWLATRKFRRTDYRNAGEEIVYCRINRKQLKKQLLIVNRAVFTREGKFKIFNPPDWNADFVQFVEEPFAEDVPGDLPF